MNCMGQMTKLAKKSIVYKKIGVRIKTNSDISARVVERCTTEPAERGGRRGQTPIEIDVGCFKRPVIGVEKFSKKSWRGV